MREFHIRYTSDVHGYLLPTTFLDKVERPTGLFSLYQEFAQDGNTLILDGGDSLQGSPLTNFLYRTPPEDIRALMPPDAPCAHPIAAAMNLCGYQYITLGNHDFNHGLDALLDYLQNLSARCLCANIRDRAGRLPIAPHAVHTLKNGLRIGLVGVCTDFVRYWEEPDTVAQLTIGSAFEAARRELELIRDRCDVTVLLYHGGYEEDLSGEVQCEPTGTENEACRMCRELDYDLILTGHQHLAVPGLSLNGTWTVQPSDMARHCCAVDARVEEDGRIRFTSSLKTGALPALEEGCRMLSALNRRLQQWLDSPAGILDRPLPAMDHLEAAIHGNPLANFINTVQLAVSGAQVATCAMPNSYKGFPQVVTIRDVVSTYIYANTLVNLSMTGATLRRYIEHTMAYFAPDGKGGVTYGNLFTKPKLQHYNYDYFSGVDYVVDILRPVGQRIVSLTRNGVPVADDEEIIVCVNSYRSHGSSGYDMVSSAPAVREILVDVADAIIEYILSHPHITIDTHRYCTLMLGEKQLS